MPHQHFQPFDLCALYKSFENIVGKETARKDQFFLFQHCFLHYLRTFCYFNRILNCHLETMSLEVSKICCLEKG